MKKAAAPRPREALLLAAGLAAVLLVFYWRNLVGFPFAKTFFWEDFIYQNYPYRAFLAEQLRAGILPFWNPYQFGGMPYVADVQAAAFYPPNALLALFVKGNRLAAEWVELLGVLHALAGGFFMALLVRNRTRCTYAASLSAVAWALGGFFVVRMIHLNILSVVTWMPAILLLLILAVEKRSLAAAAAGGLLFGVSTLAGAPQYTLFIAFLLGLYAFVEMIRGRRKGLSRLAPACHLAVVVGVGGGLSAVQFLPTTQLADLSMRSEMTYEKSTEVSLTPASFATLILPKLYGSAAGWRNDRYWGPGSYFYSWESTAYTGIVILLLAALALLYSSREKGVIFAAVLAVFGIVLALGGYGPLHPLFYKFLPMYDKFRCPGRALILTAFALVFLAGRGARLLGDRPPKSRFAGRSSILVIVGILAATGTVAFFAASSRAATLIGKPFASGDALRAYLFFLVVTAAASVPVIRWSRSSKRLSRASRGFLLLLAVGELFVYGFGYNDGAVDPNAFYRGRSDPVERIRAAVGGEAYRVKTRAPEGLILPRNQGTINHLRSVDGYNQLLLERFNTIRNDATIPLGRRLDLLGVKVYAAFDTTRRSLTLQVNESALPRAYFVGSGEPSGGAAATIERIGEPSFDPRRTVVLEGEAETVRGNASGRAEVSRWGPNRIDITVTSDGPGYLVLNEIAFPAWKVYVNGEEREALTADYAFRAVRLEGGANEVSWRYRSDRLRAGLAVTAVTLVLCALYLFIGGPRRGDRLAVVLRGVWKGSR